MNADVNAVRRSQEFFRLKRVVQSPGDIYELDVSSRALYIGPDSDVSEVRVLYADPDAPLGVQTADVSVNGSFVGAIGVDLAQQIPSTLQPQRILVYPVDIVDNTYTQPIIGPLAPTRQYNVPAILDLIVALKTLPSIPQVRADKTYRFPNTPYEDVGAPVGNGSTSIIVPMYGRRMVTVQVVTTNEYSLDVSIVALQPGLQPLAKSLGGLSNAAATSVATTKSCVVRASDAVAFVNGTTSVPTTYTELAEPLPSAKGLADLLVLNISTPSAVPGLRFADIFVKLSDREV